MLEAAGAGIRIIWPIVWPAVLLFKVVRAEREVSTSYGVTSLPLPTSMLIYRKRNMRKYYTKNLRKLSPTLIVILTDVNNALTMPPEK